MSVRGVDSARRGERSPNEFSREGGMRGGGGGGSLINGSMLHHMGQTKNTSMKRIEMLSLSGWRI